MRRRHRIAALLANPLVLAVLILVGGLALYGIQLTSTEMNGDAAVYASQVARSDLSELTLHAGFLALGIVFDRLLPGPATVALNAMSAIFGALGAGLTAWLTWRLTGSRIAEAVAGLGLLLAGNYWTHALHAEVYVAQTCLVLLTWVCWVEGKSLWAGLAFLAAMLISPLSALALPALLMAGTGNKQSALPLPTRYVELPQRLWRQALAFSLAWLPAYSLFVWLNHQEYVSRHSFVPGTWRYDLPYSLGFLAFSFLFLWPLVGLGALLTFNRSRRGHQRLLLAITLTLVTHVLVVGRLSDHGAFFLPTYPLLAVLAGLGSQGLMCWDAYPARERCRWLKFSGGLGLLVAAGGALALSSSLFAQHARRYFSEFDTSLAWLYAVAVAAAVAGWALVRNSGVRHTCWVTAHVAGYHQSGIDGLATAPAGSADPGDQRRARGPPLDRLAHHCYLVAGCALRVRHYRLGGTPGLVGDQRRGDQRKT